MPLKFKVNSIGGGDMPTGNLVTGPNMPLGSMGVIERHYSSYSEDKGALVTRTDRIRGVLVGVIAFDPGSLRGERSSIRLLAPSESVTIFQTEE